MNLEQYIFNRNYQHSKEAPIYNLNISILVTVGCLDQLPPSNYRTLQQNGLEVFFLFIDAECSIPMPTIRIEKFPFGNWVILSCKSAFLLTSLLKEIKTEITRDYVLLVNSIDYLNAITIEDLVVLSSTISQYNNYFLSYNRRETEALLFSQKEIDRIASYSLGAYCLNNESLQLVKRSLELSGLIEISMCSDEYSDICDYHNTDLCNNFGKSIAMELEYIKYQYYEKKLTVNSLNERTITNKIYDYRKKEQSFNQLLSYLNEFEAYELFDSLYYKKKYQNIVLVQSYNEADNVIDFFDNMGLFFDGIIMLDDESSDGTYDIATHEKLLLKVRKERQDFLDMDNRNILLALASFYPVEWLCFMDFDERFNLKFANFSFMNNKQIDTVAFNVIHLWNNPELFNASFPGTYKGIEKIFRMFRNIGYSQIKSSKKFHFAATPYFGRQYFDSGILVMHHAFLHEDNRRRKYEFYTKNDPLAIPNQYDYLINDCHLLKKIETLSIEKISNIEYNSYLEK